MSETAPQKVFQPPDDRGEWTLMTDVRVSGGRVTVRRDTKDRHGFGKGDIVDVVVVRPDGDRIEIPEAEITSRDRVTIPKQRLELHDIEGEWVDVWLRDTGLTAPP